MTVLNNYNIHNSYSKYGHGRIHQSNMSRKEFVVLTKMKKKGRGRGGRKGRERVRKGRETE